MSIKPVAAGAGAGAAKGGGTASDPSQAAAAQDPSASDPSASGNTDPNGQFVSNLAGVTLPHDKPPVPLLFYVVGGIALALVVFGPPIYGLRLSRKPEIPGPDDGVTAEGTPRL